MHINMAFWGYQCCTESRKLKKNDVEHLLEYYKNGNISMKANMVTCSPF